jgi:DNA-binding NtrC family response regulator
VPGEPLVPLKTYLRQQEQAHLNRAIRQCDGDKEQAALMLGISMATLYRRLAEEDAKP